MIKNIIEIFIEVCNIFFYIMVYATVLNHYERYYDTSLLSYPLLVIGGLIWLLDRIGVLNNIYLILDKRS